MTDIQSIYIIDSIGTPFFVRDIYIQGIESSDHALLTNFISAIQSFASEIGGGHTKIIKLGESKIFTIKDTQLNIFFVIKSNLKAKDKKIFQILSEIRNIFITKFTGKITVSGEEKVLLLDSLRNDIDDLFKNQDKVGNFLANL